MIQLRLADGSSSQEANIRNKGFVLSKDECLHQTLNPKTKNGIFTVGKESGYHLNHLLTVTYQ